MKTVETAQMLTPKQQVFCREYLVDLNATQAAIRAGYSVKSANEQGSRLLANVKVAAYVELLMEERSTRLDVNADYVLATIVDTIERCRQRVRPMIYKNGDPVLIETENGSLAHAYAYDASSVLRGAELLGRHLKMFTDKVEHSGAGGRPSTVITACMSAEEASKLYQEMLAQ